MKTFKKIINPFREIKGDKYFCFGCSPDNREGLHLDFYSDGDRLFARWNPERKFEGYHNVVHGGIQATLMDEIASWTVYALLDTAGVTQRMQVNYHSPVYRSKGLLNLSCEVRKRTPKQAVLYTEIKDGNQKVLSDASVEYYLFPPEVARAKYHYPGKQAFWK